jgi:predicted secreted acid phosphatase
MFTGMSLDDTDMFRPVEEWTQIVSDRQQNVVRGATEFLTPAQMETLKGLVALNLEQWQEQRAQRCKALGIKNGAQN